VLAFCCVLFVLQSEVSTDEASQSSQVHDAADDSGVLITGGFNSVSAELYVPSSGASCTLPSLPDDRWHHTVTEGGLLCGGGYTGTLDSCLQWSPDSGTWEEALTLDEWRSRHVSWTPSSGNTGTYLMGGGPSSSSRKTSTLLNNDGTQEPGFPLKYDAYVACAIPDPITDTVVVTGGADTETTVVRYGQQGWLEDLPPLITGRYDHACSSFMSAGRLMFLVTGGYYDGYYLDSTETFDPLVGSWTASRAKLPRPMYGIRAENSLLFGGQDSDLNYHDDILEYDLEEDTITLVGRMIQARAWHAISVVPAGDYLQWCDGSM